MENTNDHGRERQMEGEDICWLFERGPVPKGADICGLWHLREAGGEHWKLPGRPGSQAQNPAEPWRCFVMSLETASKSSGEQHILLGSTRGMSGAILLPLARCGQRAQLPGRQRPSCGSHDCTRQRERDTDFGGPMDFPRC